MPHEKDAPGENAPFAINEADTAGEEEANPQTEALENPRDEENTALAEQVAALTDQFARARAENDNLRKRQARELSNAYKYATEKLHRDLLPVIDSLTLGLQAAKDSAEQETSGSEALAQFIEGLEMTHNMFRDILAKHGVEEIDPVGEKFNPQVHEAVTMMASADHQPNTVIQVAQKGYLLNGRTIRAAQVIVSKGEK